MQSERTGRRQAFLLPGKLAGFDVLVHRDVVHNSALGRRRLRYTLAHEVGHSFFFNRRAVPHNRHCEWSAEEERFCDSFAEELLVPSRDVKTLPWAQTMVRSIRDRYDVSLEAAARAAVRHHFGAVAVGLLESDHPTKGRALRVAWSAGAFVPDGAQLRSAVADAAWASGSASGTEQFALGHLRGIMQVSAERERQGRLVLVLLRPRSPQEERQLELFPRAWGPDARGVGT